MTRKNKNSDDCRVAKRTAQTSNVTGQVSIGDVRVLYLPPGPVDIEKVRSRHSVNVVMNTNKALIGVNSDKLKEQTIVSESFAFFPMGSTISLKCQNELPELSVEFGDDTVEKLLDGGFDFDFQSTNENMPYVRNPVVTDLARIALKHFEEVEAGAEVDVLLIDAISLGVLARLIHLGEVTKGLKSSKVFRSGSERHKERIQNSIEYAKSRLPDRDLRISDMADVAGISAAHFSEVFKEIVGVSPYSFVKNERLKYAKDLLTFTNMPLSEVSYAAGFSSQAHLTTAIQDRFGRTPGSFRK